MKKVYIFFLYPVRLIFVTKLFSNRTTTNINKKKETLKLILHYSSTPPPQSQLPHTQTHIQQIVSTISQILHF
jgi:hypothetical protein